MAALARHGASLERIGDAGDVPSLADVRLWSGAGQGRNPMDRRNVLALAGEDPDAVREGVRVAPADCEAPFRVREPNKRMKDKAAHACRALCCARVTEELQRRRGTQIAEHLKLVRNFLNRPGRVES
jgi:ethanolamine utilization microcompartment shell protein EutL